MENRFLFWKYYHFLGTVRLSDLDCEYADHTYEQENSIVSEWYSNVFFIETYKTEEEMIKYIRNGFKQNKPAEDKTKEHNKKWEKFEVIKTIDSKDL